MQTSISMAGVIASQTRPETARCIDTWYYENEATKRTRHEEILQTMPDYAEFTPHAFLLAYLESVCGTFSGD